MISPLSAAGAFASSNPRVTVLGGSLRFRAPEPDGLAVGVFAWANPATGYATNSKPNDETLLGFVLPVRGGNQRVYLTPGRVHIRPGIEVTLAAAGDFVTLFPYGAIPGQPVYASTVDGTPISGYSDDAQLTSWAVVSYAAPGQLAIISTWSKIQ